MAVPLPPLPTAGDDELDYRPGGRSVLEILAEEHDRIAAHLSQLTDPDIPVGHRGLVAEAVTAAVTRHLSAEEQYLYPAVRAALPDGDALADREIAADTELLRALGELTGVGPEDPRFDRLAETAAGQLRRHAHAATGQIHPALRQVATAAELIRLGNRVEIAEEAAPTRPHPDHPVSPPWNRLVEPALGVADKLRDALTGRRTYLEDLPPVDRDPSGEPGGPSGADGLRSGGPGATGGGDGLVDRSAR